MTVSQFLVFLYKIQYVIVGVYSVTRVNKGFPSFHTPFGPRMYTLFGLQLAADCLSLEMATLCLRGRFHVMFGVIIHVPQTHTSSGMTEQPSRSAIKEIPITYQWRNPALNPTIGLH